MQIENIKISSLKPYEKNARTHPQKQVDLLCKNIEKFGFTTPVLVDENNSVIAGHGRLLALSQLGRDEAPCVRIEGLTEEEVKALRLADNQIAQMGDFDMNLVIEELKGLSESMLELTGFDKDLIIEPDEQDDVVPDVPEEPQSKLGDLYELGNHRLMCGDSTLKEHVDVLMNGHKADMIFTDPPYNVDYKGKGENTKNGIMNDKMSDEAFDIFLVEAFNRMAENTKRTAGCYIFHSHKTASDFEKALQLAGFTIDTQLIWNKPSAGMGMNDYRTKHEPFFYAYLSKEDKNFYGDRTGTTVWKIPQDEEKAFKWFLKEQEALEKGGTTVWTMSRASTSEYVHPTQKPAELPVTAITKSSKPDDIVLDLFLGSGTTLIGAEKTGRVCYGMELDEKYIDVIIERWCQFTGIRDIIKNGEKYRWEAKE